MARSLDYDDDYGLDARSTPRSTMRPPTATFPLRRINSE
jgi:hypothetical protein